MAENWPWESSSRAPPTSSTQTSPLQSVSSQSSHEASAVAAELIDRPQTLVETLRTCLANAAPTEPPAAAVATAGRSDPLRQPLRGSGSKSGMKRRSRASRRVPTTVVEATCSDFRETVHRLTGIPTTPASAPVRPQPQRASFIPPRPQQPSARVPPAPRPQQLNPLLHLTEAPPPMHPVFWSREPQLDPTFVKSESAERFSPGIGGSSQSALANTMSQLASAPLGSIQTWWDAAPQPQPQSFLLNPTSTTTGPFDSSGTTSGAGGPILQDDFEDWFHQDHTGSDYMR